MTPCSSTSEHIVPFHQKLCPGSSLIRSSGHGGQTPDLDGDEDDGYDEVIYPVDFKQQGHIVDDDREFSYSAGCPNQS